MWDLRSPCISERQYWQDGMMCDSEISRRRGSRSEIDFDRVSDDCLTDRLTSQLWRDVLESN